jgi:hypothetical protein
MYRKYLFVIISLKKKIISWHNPFNFVVEDLFLQHSRWILQLIR